MAEPYIEPFGFVEGLTADGATFTLSRPVDSLSLLPDTPVTVWRYTPVKGGDKLGHGAL